MASIFSIDASKQKCKSLHSLLIPANSISQPKQAKIQFLILSNKYRNSSSLSINWNKQKSEGGGELRSTELQNTEKRKSLLHPYHLQTTSNHNHSHYSISTNLH
jgi:hypothetical protein